jgi:IS605 OrfB family transposase
MEMAMTTEEGVNVSLTANNDKLYKAKKIRIYPTSEQKQIFEKWFDTSNYVYNKAIEAIREGHAVNFQGLRDLLVTNNTKKYNTEDIDQCNKIKELQQLKRALDKNKVAQCFGGQFLLDELINEIDDEKVKLRKLRKTLIAAKNNNIQEWETDTPKDIRAGAVQDVVKAYKTGFSNLKAGNIRFFNPQFRKRDRRNGIMELTKVMAKIKDNKLIVAKSTLKKNSEIVIKQKLNNKTVIDTNTRLQMRDNKWFIIVPILIEVKQKLTPETYCGIDPGIRTFMTCFGNDSKREYTHDRELIDKLNKAIDLLKWKRIRYKRKSLTKRELKKENIVNELHWKTVNSIVSKYDVIFYGDIKSHDIVTKGQNKRLNRDFNDLKFWQFKNKLEYKALVNGKRVIPVNEAYTTKTCTCCGKLNSPGSSSIFNCWNCNIKIGRDENGSRNILLKGLTAMCGG